MPIGFIGLGVMDAPTARNLATAGHDVVNVLRRSPLPNDLFAPVLGSPANGPTTLS